MSSKYTVEKYTITRRDEDGQWDDQSARDVVGFDNLDDAKKAFSEADVKGQWMTEKACSQLQIVKTKVMAVELCENVLDEDGEIQDADIVDYTEFGYSDYVKDCEK